MKGSFLHTALDTTAVASVSSDVVQVELYDNFAYTLSYDVTTPAAATVTSTDVNVTTNVITKANHGFVTGVKGQFTTTDTLPAGLSLLTDYFLIAATSGTLKVATSLANARAGTAVDITTQGVGNHTFTPTAISCSAQVKASIDGSEYFNLGSPVTVTADGIAAGLTSSNAYQYVKCDVTQTAGQVAFKFKVRGTMS